jgi:hypothetical protein
MGIKLDHVRQCARRAAIDGTPGVIAIACGRERLEVVKACVLQENLVNELFIDDDLAQALGDSLGPSDR